MFGCMLDPLIDFREKPNREVRGEGMRCLSASLGLAKPASVDMMLGRETHCDQAQTDQRGVVRHCMVGGKVVIRGKKR